MSSGTIDAAHFSPDIRAFILLLHKHQVKYLIVGGEAVIYYGHSRLTGDIDFFYEFSPENVKRIYNALNEFWAGNIPGINDAMDFTRGLIVQFGIPPNRIDLINEIDGVHFEEAWPSRLTVSMAGGHDDCEIHYIGIEELKRNKEASARPKDLDDLVFLKR